MDPTVKSESCSIIKGTEPDPLKAFKRQDRDADEIQTVIRKMVKRYEFYMESSFSKYSGKYYNNVEWNFRVIIFFKSRLLLQLCQMNNIRSFESHFLPELKQQMYSQPCPLILVNV